SHLSRRQTPVRLNESAIHRELHEGGNRGLPRRALGASQRRPPESERLHLQHGDREGEPPRPRVQESLTQRGKPRDSMTHLARTTWFWSGTTMMRHASIKLYVTKPTTGDVTMIRSSGSRLLACMRPSSRCC